MKQLCLSNKINLMKCLSFPVMISNSMNNVGILKYFDECPLRPFPSSLVLALCYEEVISVTFDIVNYTIISPDLYHIGSSHYNSLVQDKNLITIHPLQIKWNTGMVMFPES
jgi:hypothetical protein